MSVKHPIVAITGSSGAGTTTVMKSFQHIFRREEIRAQILEGDSMHRYNRMEMREQMKKMQETGNTSFSHFSPDANLLGELDQTFGQFAKDGSGRVRKYIHDDIEAAQFKQEPGTFTPWQDMEAGAELLFYEGLHGGYVGADANVAQHVDLLVGVVPIINLEWIQKLHRDQNMRGYSQEAVLDTILRRMPDYTRHICPQFSRTHVNFQRVPTVDTSNPFIAKDIPTADESMVVIRFTKPNTFVIPGGKMGLAMQLIFTPMILRLMDKKRRA